MKQLYYYKQSLHKFIKPNWLTLPHSSHVQPTYPFIIHVYITLQTINEHPARERWGKLRNDWPFDTWPRVSPERPRPQEAQLETM